MKKVKIEYHDYAGHPYRERFVTTTEYNPKDAKRVMDNLYILGCRDMRMVPTNQKEI